MSGGGRVRCEGGAAPRRPAAVSPRSISAKMMGGARVGVAGLAAAWAGAWAAALAGAPALADPVAEILARAAAECAAHDAGVFEAGAPVTEVDLDRDGALDRIVDESAFSCSTARTMYCGTGGCMLHAVVGEAVASFQAEGWRLEEWSGHRILLIARDGGWCGGAGAQLCFEAVTWSGGEMLTVMRPAQ